jgi:NAD(P)-dependent dehydrogenase (short-subunit alcohol dehydrogenase family)
VALGAAGSHLVLIAERIEQLTEPAADLTRLRCSFTALSWSSVGAREVCDEIDWIDRTLGPARLVVNAMQYEATPHADAASPQEIARLWNADISLVQLLLTSVLTRTLPTHSRTSEQLCIAFVDAACRCEAHAAPGTAKRASGLARIMLTEAAATLYAPYGASICSICPHMLPPSPPNDACSAITAACPPPRCGTDPDAFAGMLHALAQSLRFEAPATKQRRPRDARRSARSR